MKGENIMEVKRLNAGLYNERRYPGRYPGRYEYYVGIRGWQPFVGIERSIVAMEVSGDC